MSVSLVAVLAAKARVGFESADFAPGETVDQALAKKVRQIISRTVVE